MCSFHKIAEYLYDRYFPDVDEELENEEEEYSPELPEYARIRERGVQASRRHIKVIIDKLALNKIQLCVNLKEFSNFHLFLLQCCSYLYTLIKI